MFYKTTVKDHVRVPPTLFGTNLDASVIKVIKEKYEGFISQEVGVVIDVSKVDSIGEGMIIPGDGASFYEATFDLITFKPEMHEVINGTIKDIADFGAFISLGPIEGMVHVSQTMDELNKIIETQRGKEKAAAKLAKAILEAKKPKTLKTTSKDYVDDLILGWEGYIVATSDRELRRELKKKGIKTIALRQKRYLVLD